MKNNTKYFIVGLVVILAIFILIWGVFFLNDKDPRDNFVDYYVIFPQISTLTHGDPVKINGVKLGRVEDMELEGHQVKVLLRIKDAVRLPKNSVVKVQNIGIMGERQVGIILGDAKEYFNHGDVIEGGFDAGIAEVMAYAGEVMDSARTLLTIVHGIMDSTIAQPKFKDSFRRLVDKAEKLENRLGGILDHADPMLRKTLGNLNTASVKVNDLIDENRQPLKSLVQDAKGITGDGARLMTTADSLVNRLMFLTGKLQSKDNTLGVLLNDDRLHRDLSQTINSADSLLKIIIDDGLDVNIDFF